MKQFEVTLAGFGGQGVMTVGQLLAYSAMNEGKKVVWLPSYGPEMRGGTAYCTVVISDSKIGSPIINSPTCCCVFNRPSFDKFSPRVKAGGLLLVNSSLIDIETDRTDITQLLVPINDVAMKAGNPKAANIVMLGALIGASKVLDYNAVEATLKDKLAGKKEFMAVNLLALKEGFELGSSVTTNKEQV